jgi:hypothetical protein
MPRSPRVFLICQPTVKKHGKLPDLTPLQKFGEVTVCVPQGMKPSRVPETALRHLRTQMEDFDPRIDFLAWAGGDTLAAVLVGIVLHERGGNGFGSFTFLRYERVRLPSGDWTDEGATYQPVVCLF